jgi:hemerythrin-like domain-containing protein
MAAQRTPLPGFGAPAVGFDTPFEMLEACHERVQRTLGLLDRLTAYLHTDGCDDSARQAARDVLRYFDIAAPLHHEDEEMHVFPPLLDNGTPEVRAAVQQLQGDHRAMHTHWQAARERLQALAQGQTDAFTPDDEALFERFASGYGAHIRTEEDLVYPAARALLAPAALQAMGAEMRRRRGAAG